MELGEHDNFIHDKFGYCYYSIEPETKPVIYNLYVEPEYRQQGHARRLLLFVLGEIHKSGYFGPVEIEADPREGSIQRDRLVAFYKSLGLDCLSAVTTNDEQRELLEQQQQLPPQGQQGP